MTITTYLNVSFFTTITHDINQGLNHLIMLIISEIIVSYCKMKQSYARQVFFLDFLKHFQTKLNQRIFGASWLRIKLSDQVEIRRKIEVASTSIQRLVEVCIDQLKEISTFIITIVTIFYICPIATILIGIIHVCFYRLHLNRRSDELLELRLKMIERYDKLQSKYSRTNSNMLEYVIHHEKNELINVTTALKIDMESQWLTFDHMYTELSFQEDMVGKLCTFISIAIYSMLNGVNPAIIPLYHYLSTLTNSIHGMLVACIRCSRLRKDYDLIEPILEEYDERINVEQIELKFSFQIQDLSYQYEGKRQAFQLRLNGMLTFRMGQSILVTGKSGAGTNLGSFSNYVF
jgi:ABC-type multidrug transport system fused ATPase/permease subunit